MADKRNPDDDSVSGRADEDVRGIAGGMDDADEFDDTDDELEDDDEEEDDEESTTF